MRVFSAVAIVLVFTVGEAQPFTLSAQTRVPAKPGPGAKPPEPRPPSVNGARPQGGRGAGGVPDSGKVTGHVVAQSETSVTVLAKSPSGEPVRKTLVLDEDTKLQGAKSEWKIASAPKGGPERIQYYDLRGKTGEFEVAGGRMKAAVMRSACDPDVCSIKACGKKCGATPCTCPAGK